jgi:Tfp pilus assembly protein PilN
MNIQINLLPEARMLKLHNKSKKTRYITIASVMGISVTAVAVVLIMLQVFLVGTYAQGENKIKDLDATIAKSVSTEQSAATLQANLASFYSLNSSRTYASRIFSNLFKAVPENITISSVSIDSKDMISISGTTNSFADVSKFATILELYNLDYLPQPDLERKAVFTEPRIESVSKSDDGKVSFSITCKVNQALLKQQRKQ